MSELSNNLVCRIIIMNGSLVCVLEVGDFQTLRFLLRGNPTLSPVRVETPKRLQNNRHPHTSTKPTTLLWIVSIDNGVDTFPRRSSALIP